MEPSFILQSAIRSRLIDTPAVTSLVPASHILDRNSRPEVFPAIILGEGQTLPAEGLARTRFTCHLDLHIWLVEPGLTGSKQVAGAIRQALMDGWWTLPGLHLVDLVIAYSRFIRDPDGIHSHGIVSLQAEVLELV